MSKRLACFLLAEQKVAVPDGIQRATCLIPTEAVVVHTGIVDPQGNIGVTVVCDARPIDKATGKSLPYTELELRKLEFLFIIHGMPVPPNCQFRVSIPGPRGLVFIFEAVAPIKPSLIVPGDRA